MYYIGIKGIKEVAMSTKKQKPDTRIKDIIKYNTSRKYFGNWTPKELNRCYPSLDPHSLYIGTLSVDDICNALWFEMSYNPTRFGTTSPFKFNGKNSLYLFIAKEPDKTSQSFHILTKIQTYLSKFWRSAIKYDENFPVINRFKNQHITIQNIPRYPMDPKPIPAMTYQMLGCLRNCIHIIASQNIKDFEKKQYSVNIEAAVKSRHPNLTRPQKAIQKNPNFLQFLRDRTRLENAISETLSEISVTQSRIDSLNNDFENPGDTSAENARLRAQMDALSELESKLKTLQQKHRIYGN